MVYTRSIASLCVVASIAFFAGSASRATGTEWKKFSDSEDGHLYVDADSVTSRRDGLVSVWVLSGEIYAGQLFVPPYLSMKILYYVDCRDRRIAVKQIHSYSKLMGQGSEQEAADIPLDFATYMFKEPAPGSDESRVLEYSCRAAKKGPR